MQTNQQGYTELQWQAAQRAKIRGMFLGFLVGAVVGAVVGAFVGGAGVAVTSLATLGTFIVGDGALFVGIGSVIGSAIGLVAGGYTAFKLKHGSSKAAESELQSVQLTNIQAEISQQHQATALARESANSIGNSLLPLCQRSVDEIEYARLACKQSPTFGKDPETAVLKWREHCKYIIVPHRGVHRWVGQIERYEDEPRDFILTANRRGRTNPAFLARLKYEEDHVIDKRDGSWTLNPSLVPKGIQFLEETPKSRLELRRKPHISLGTLKQSRSDPRPPLVKVYPDSVPECVQQDSSAIVVAGNAYNPGGALSSGRGHDENNAHKTNVSWSLPKHLWINPEINPDGISDDPKTADIAQKLKNHLSVPDRDKQDGRSGLQAVGGSIRIEEVTRYEFTDDCQAQPQNKVCMIYVANPDFRPDSGGAQKWEMLQTQVGFETFMAANYENIRMTLQHAQAAEIKHLILNPTGCGIFENPPHFVAAAFRLCLEEFRRIDPQSEMTFECPIYESTAKDKALSTVFNKVLNEDNLATVKESLEYGSKAWREALNLGHQHHHDGENYTFNQELIDSEKEIITNIEALMATINTDETDKDFGETVILHAQKLLVAQPSESKSLECCHAYLRTQGHASYFAFELLKAGLTYQDLTDTMGYSQRLVEEGVQAVCAETSASVQQTASVLEVLQRNGSHNIFKALAMPQSGDAQPSPQSSQSP